MTQELYWLTLTAFMTSLFFLPYVLNRISMQGLFGSMGYLPINDPEPPAWAMRAMAAHKVAMENLPIFAALILASHLTGISNSITSTAAMVYFFGMMTHYVVFTLGIPYVRTVAFLGAGFGAEVALALTLLDII